MKTLPIGMEVTTQILRDSQEPLSLKNLASRVITVAIIPFMLIAAFEGIVINGARSLINLVITLINSAASLCPKKEDEVVLETQPEETPEVEKPEVVLKPFIPMPLAKNKDKEKVYEVFTTLANNSYVALAFKRNRLNELDRELTPLHPLQFLEAIYGEKSKIKTIMPKIINSYLTREETVKGLSKGLARPEHAKMLQEYIPGFAKSVALTTEEAKALLLPVQDWHALLDRLTKLEAV